ncbi:MAG: hypothetical protein ABH836_08395 [Candidatus Omnitrophota bacterium]
MPIFKCKKSWILFIVVLAAGFLVTFFYQTTVNPDFVEFKKTYDFYAKEKTENFFLLNGWQLKQEENKTFASMRGGRAVFLFFAPERDSLALKITYRAHSPWQEIAVYSGDEFIGGLKSDVTGQWVDRVLILPRNLVVNTLNKLIVVKKLGSESDFYRIIVSNCEEKRIAFLRMYTVWRTRGVFTGAKNNSVDWKFCIAGAFGLVSFWLIYSALLYSISNEKYFYILKSDFWTYSPALMISAALFLISRTMSDYVFFYYNSDYFLMLMGLPAVLKVYQIVKYAKKEKVKLRICRLKRNIAEKYDIAANMSIVFFIMLFFSSALLLMFNMKLKAESLANPAFLFLTGGVLLKMVKYFIRKEYS